MVSDHEAGAVETLGLVDQHVATLVVRVVGNDRASRHGRGGGVFRVQHLDQLSGLGPRGSTHV